MQVEAAIDSWRQWDVELNKRPVLLETMSGGRSNRSFLLESGDRRMVLRLNGGDSILPAADRSHESTIWQAASEKGIAPPLFHVDEHHRFLVSTYVHNTLPRRKPVDRSFVTQAFALLRHCHELAVDVPAIDYAGHIEHYWNIAERANVALSPALLEQRATMQNFAEEIVSSGARTGLCHHDLVMDNFVGSAQHLYLIDWEYAMHGLQIMDFAAIGIEWGIDDATVLAHTGAKPELLLIAKKLYRYLCDLWEEVTA